MTYIMAAFFTAKCQAPSRPIPKGRFAARIAIFKNQMALIMSIWNQDACVQSAALRTANELRLAAEDRCSLGQWRAVDVRKSIT
jgi:hypothetical protein